MLKRFSLIIWLALLFAFMQIGVVSHAISHFDQIAHQSSSDKNTNVEHCGQCIADAQSANATPPSSFNVVFLAGKFHFSSNYFAHSSGALSTSYFARAPPISQEV